MTKPCTVPRCSEPATGYSQHCDSHKKNLRRHGHPLQAGITVHQLAPYTRLVQNRRMKNPSSDLWSILEERWSAIRGSAEATLARYASGTAVIRTDILAAEQVRRLALGTTAAAVADTVLAMFLLRDAEPRRFQSDKAFLFQIVRRVRGLTDMNAGQYWDHNAKRSRRVYQDVPPKVVDTLASQLVGAFGAVGLILAAKEREERSGAQLDAQRLARAVEGLA